ncbi:MAG: hypothetical protein J0I77_09445 [Rudaea sp.]|uniref:hypothetical protein n=1 Tax=unclassified Rudaea TaxID=2627037 RepID=UPI0010F760A8|nr:MULTISPECIES: hypothetical protein [unclassified Rudaea]MBN8885931.1 hypothetical protein [Rudaea sp.]MBR0347004.1 hypothetical protein [Rudaea sp.]
MARPRTKRSPEQTDGIEAAQVDHAALEAAGAESAQLSQQLALIDRDYGIGVEYNRAALLIHAKHLVANIGLQSLELGLIFLQVRAREPHGEFLSALQEVGVSPRFAQKAMQVARKFGGDAHRKQLAERLGMSKVLALIAEDDADIGDLAEGGELAGFTADEFATMTKDEVVAALRAERDERADEKAADEEIIRKKDERINKLSRRATRSGTREQIKELLKDVSEYSTEAGSFLNKMRQTIGTINELYTEAGEQPDEDVTQALEKATEFAHHWANELAKDLGD